MRSKSPLTLIELIIMIAVFAVAAALCLRAFVWSDIKSADNQERDRAVIVAQTAAEEIKAAHHAADYVEKKDGFTVSVACQETGSQYLGSALVTVADEDNNTLVELTVSWQEDAE